MAKLPLRALGLLLLVLTIGIATCQSLFHATEPQARVGAIEHRENRS